MSVLGDAVLTVRCHTCHTGLERTIPEVVAAWLITHRECATVTVVNEDLLALECSLLASDLAGLVGS